MPLMDNPTLDRSSGGENRLGVPEKQQILLARAAYLLKDDRILLELAIRGQMTQRQIGQILSLPPGTISRKLRRLGNRLYNPLVIALLDKACPLPREYRQLGIEYFLQNRPLRELAESHQLTGHEVRGMIEHLRGWHRGITAMRRLAEG